MYAASHHQRNTRHTILLVSSQDSVGSSEVDMAIMLLSIDNGGAAGSTHHEGVTACTQG
jgi:hypothetical protein